jgi:cytochrome c peroxidase
MPPDSNRPRSNDRSPKTSQSISSRRWLPGTALVGAIVVAGAVWLAYHPAHAPAFIADQLGELTGANPHPVTLLRPPVAPLSAMALLGKDLFYDKSLSASGQQSCASCHSPDHAYGPVNDVSVQLGGAHMDQQGQRPPPTLMYLYRQPGFSIGPDAGEADAPPDMSALASQASGTTRAQKNAGAAPAAPAMVPQGGLFWDGRVDSLQDQAQGPMLNLVEMANTSVAEAQKKLDTPVYHERFAKLFGAGIFRNGNQLMSEALFAISRYQLESTSFHPYSSKYDAWLEGKARMTAAEQHGMNLFNDPAKANCAGCHLSAVTPDGLPPMFTDYQYEALGVPRNMDIALNKNPHYYDMGVCGPYRTDLTTLTQYCGMFLTPTLRNAATRHVFFHNGKYHNLTDVMNFYNERNTDPAKFYPRGPDGKVNKYDDLPAQFHGNVDVADAPFDRKLGDKPAMTDAEIKDIITFLGTLNDGYFKTASNTQETQ